MLSSIESGEYMFKYVLFDFDGTLIDTNDLITRSLTETARKFLNIDLSKQDVKAILGMTLEEQMKYMSQTMWQQMLAYYKEFYKSNHDMMIKEFPGIRHMLHSLKAHGCKTAIVSSKGRNGIKRGLEYLQLEGYIDVVISAYDVKNCKPHPEPALKALELLEGQSDPALMVGDSTYDILCAKNSGISSVLVGWSIFPKAEILRLNPDFVAKTPEDLVKIVLGK